MKKVEERSLENPQENSISLANRALRPFLSGPTIKFIKKLALPLNFNLHASHTARLLKYLKVQTSFVTRAAVEKTNTKGKKVDGQPLIELQFEQLAKCKLSQPFNFRVFN